MKAFFMEYGKLIVTGALTVTGLMFTTPFAEAVTGSVANFTSRFSEKNEESMELVTIGLEGSGGGSTPVVDGTNITLSTDADGNGVVSKGDKITFATSYLYSGSNTGPTEFLVLNSNGSDVELFATTNYQNSKFNSSANNTYENSEVDTLLNTTYYNSLSSNVQSKIKSKSITQNTWQYTYNGTPADVTVTRLDSSTYKYKKTGVVGTYDRKVYALDIQDVINYLGTSFTGAQLNSMFFGTNERVNKYAWLRSAHSGLPTYAFLVTGTYGYIGHSTCSGLDEVRPAFTITLN